tara:strand:- start:55 stop:375 length:321 start_codon:yes stop_codon:yes gene_type:complete
LTAKRSLINRALDSLSSPAIQDALVKLLEREASRFILKKLLISGGVKAWLLSFIVSELIEEADEHLIEPAFRALGYQADKLEGAKIFKKVDNASDVKEWIDSLDAV